MMQPEALREIAGAVRYNAALTDPAQIVEVLNEAANYIDHLRDLSARLASHEDRTGYHPHVAEADGRQVLVAIFTDEAGAIDGVQLAFRESPYDSWSPPIEAVRG